MRNQENNILNWYQQIKNIVKQNEQIEFGISVYENNSTDKTSQMLESLNFDFMVHKTIISENLANKPFFQSNHQPYSKESKLRVQLLAESRNKCLESNFLKDVNYVLFIEPDIKYDVSIFKELLNFITRNKYDIVSAISLGPTGEHYDRWGTRLQKGDTWFDFTPYLFNDEKMDVYSTFNCFVIYNSKPFNDKMVRFKGFSEVLNIHDCDTVTICEEFRKHNYNKICLLPSCMVHHN